MSQGITQSFSWMFPVLDVFRLTCSKKSETIADGEKPTPTEKTKLVTQTPVKTYSR